MRIALLNAYKDQGGAAIACLRLFNVLSKNSANKVSFIYTNQKNIIGKYTYLFRLSLEKLYLSFFEKSSKTRFQFSIANTGKNLSISNAVINADIIHLHWINNGFLSLKNLDQIGNLEIPVVWTLHDMWPFTGGCHYSGTCDHYKINCGNCFYLKNPSPTDLSSTIISEKQKNSLFKIVNIVTCSNWLAGLAKESILFKNNNVYVIPNPINTNSFSPGDKLKLRKKYNIDTHKKIILFASASITDKRKGFSYLVEALSILNNIMPGMNENILLIVMGKSKVQQPVMFSFPTNFTGYISNQATIAEYYALSDVFVSPALEDNLPNTVMESMACGTPCVAFNTGGLSDLIDNELNGYLAEFKSSESLAKGIKFILENDAFQDMLSKAARKKVEHNFAEDIVAKKYEDLYKKIILEKSL